MLASCAPVAQGIERLPSKQRVVGSNPTWGTISFQCCPPVFAIASIWKLAAMMIAIRQAFAYSSTWRAVGVAVVGFIPYAVVSSIVYALA